jgi:hypothetical protein
MMFMIPLTASTRPDNAAIRGTVPDLITGLTNQATNLMTGIKMWKSRKPSILRTSPRIPRVQIYLQTVCSLSYRSDVSESIEPHLLDTLIQLCYPQEQCWQWGCKAEIDGEIKHDLPRRNPRHTVGSRQFADLRMPILEKDEYRPTYCRTDVLPRHCQGGHLSYEEVAQNTEKAWQSPPQSTPPREWRDEMGPLPCLPPVSPRPYARFLDHPNLQDASGNSR